MARTLILNISASAQTLPAAYGSHTVAVGHGRVVSDETTIAVSEMGGFAAIDGNWVVYPVSTDTAEGDYDVAAGGVALLATFVPGGGGGGGGPVNWADILSKPSFATVATSGSYEDLADVPTLAGVATTGLYSDLSGTPSIPVAGNTVADVGNTGGAGVAGTFSRVDHQHAHGNLNGGSLHSTVTSVTAGFMSAADKTKLDGLAAVATSGAYADLSGAPALALVAASGSFNDLSDTPALFSGSYTDLTDKPEIPDLTTLAPVASSGAYEDLSGKPSLASVATSGSYADLSNKPTAAYDIASFASGSLALAATTTKFYAPKNLTLTALNQGGGATVKVQVAGADITFPKSVTAGQLITIVVTAAGTDNYFTISAVEA